MIFSTKNKELAIFGHSLGNIKKKLIDFNNNLMQGRKSSPQGQQIISEENLIQELSFDEAKNKLDNFTNIVINGNKTLDEYFTMFPENNDVLRTYVTTIDQQYQSTQGLVKASQEARAAQLAHNEASKAQTFSAKAGTVAIKALATAGNMLLFLGITKGIELAVKGIDKMIETEKEAEEALENAKSVSDSYKSSINNAISSQNELASNTSDIKQRYAELSQGVDSMSNKNLSLSTDDYKEFLDLNSQLANLFPTLTKGYDENGNAILGLGGNIDIVTGKIQALDIY